VSGSSRTDRVRLKADTTYKSKRSRRDAYEEPRLLQCTMGAIFDVGDPSMECMGRRGSCCESKLCVGYKLIR